MSSGYLFLAAYSGDRRVFFTGVDEQNAGTRLLYVARAQGSGALFRRRPPQQEEPSQANSPDFSSLYMCRWGLVGPFYQILHSDDTIHCLLFL